MYIKTNAFLTFNWIGEIVLQLRAIVGDRFPASLLEIEAGYLVSSLGPDESRDTSLFTKNSGSLSVKTEFNKQQVCIMYASSIWGF